jgi:hypothetical protein
MNKIFSTETQRTQRNTERKKAESLKINSVGHRPMELRTKNEELRVKPLRTLRNLCVLCVKKKFKPQGS